MYCNDPSDSTTHKCFQKNKKKKDIVVNHVYSSLRIESNKKKKNKKINIVDYLFNARSTLRSRRSRAFCSYVYYHNHTRILDVASWRCISIKYRYYYRLRNLNTKQLVFLRSFPRNDLGADNRGVFSRALRFKRVILTAGFRGPVFLRSRVSASSTFCTVFHDFGGSRMINEKKKIKKYVYRSRWKWSQLLVTVSSFG